jgi:hypothetical protein
MLACSPLLVAALPSMSLIPSAPFTNSHQLIKQLTQALCKFVKIRAISVFVAIVSCATSCGFSSAQESPRPQEEHTSVSPDKQWEYRCANGVSPEIAKAGATQVVLDPSEDLDVSRAEEAEVVWAPDSKRFAFNYTAPSAAHTSYKMIALYQLRGDKWVRLRSLVDESSERLQLAQLAKKQLPKSAYSRSAEPIRDILKVRNWIDANTAILYGYAAWTGGGPQDSKATFLFTLKFDAEGHWKIVKTHRMSKKEIEKEDAAER